MFKHRIDSDLYIRILERQHARELFELTVANREHLSQWLPWVDQVTDVEHSLTFIERALKQFAAGNGCQFGIWHQDRLAGVVGYHQWDFVNRATSLGYWLARDQQGRGLVTRVCGVLVDYAFSELDFIRVEIRCAVDNARSRAVPRRLGFTSEGLMRRGEVVQDRILDHVVYGLLREEWEASEVKRVGGRTGQDPEPR